MKIRTGFVSNSSSSSFVVFGYVIPESLLKEKMKKLEDEDFSMWEWAEENDMVALSGGEGGFKDGEQFFGVFIADFDNEDGENRAEKMNLKQLAEAAEEIKKTLKEELDIDVTGEPDIYSGVRMC